MATMSHVSQQGSVHNTTTVVGAPAPTVVYSTCTQPTYQGYKETQVRAMGIIQVVVGVLAFVFQCVAIHLNAGIATAAPGIWCGIFFCISGGLAIGSASSKTSCIITGTLVMTIISLVFVVPLLAVACWAIDEDSDCDDDRSYYYNRYHYYDDDDKNCKAMMAFDVCLLLIAITELFAGIYQVVLCSLAVCCGVATPGAVVQTPVVGGAVVTGAVVQPGVVQTSGVVMSSPVGYAVTTPVQQQYTTTTTTNVPGVHQPYPQQPGNPPPYNPEPTKY